MWFSSSIERVPVIGVNMWLGNTKMGIIDQKYDRLGSMVVYGFLPESKNILGWLATVNYPFVSVLVLTFTTYCP